LSHPSGGIFFTHRRAGIPALRGVPHRGKYRRSRMNKDMDKLGLTEKLLHFMVEEVDRMRDLVNDLNDEIDYKDRLLAEKAEIIMMLGQQLKQKGQPKKVTSVTTAPKKVGRPKGSKNRVKK
jgi:hypothetical protein